MGRDMINMRHPRHPPDPTAVTRKTAMRADLACNGGDDPRDRKGRAMTLPSGQGLRTHVGGGTTRITLIAAVMMPMRGVAAAVIRELQLRHDERMLARMDDHELSDLGIGRGQIPDAVRSGRISRWDELV